MDKLTIIQTLMLIDELNAEAVAMEDPCVLLLRAAEEHITILPDIKIPNTKGPQQKRGKGKYKRY